MPTRRWNVKYGEHQLEVENYWSIGMIWNRRKARLFVDGECVDEHISKGILTLGQGGGETILRGNVDIEGKKKVIKVIIRSGGVSFKCNINIDGDVIFEE